MSDFDEFAKNFNITMNERDRLVSQRKDNMWKGPIGLEESLAQAHDDISMLSWGIGRLIKILADERASQSDAGDGSHG
jgi:hypothetical protein